MIRKLAGLAVLVAAVPMLQACFPLAVTGMGAAAIMATDRRTTGTYVEDEGIEWKALARLRQARVARWLFIVSLQVVTINPDTRHNLCLGNRNCGHMPRVVIRAHGSARND